MALKHGSSSGIDMRELIEVIEAFEQHNSVRITLRCELTTWVRTRDLQWTAEAWDRGGTVVGARPLAYAHVRCGERRLGTMEAVLLQLLYALDFQLAENAVKADSSTA